MVALPTLLLCSASAILKALTMVSVWPFGEPVRGRLETMRIVPLRLLAAAAAGLGEAAATGDGDDTGLATGLAAAADDGLAAVAGEAAAAAGFVGAAAG